MVDHYNPVILKLYVLKCQYRPVQISGQDGGIGRNPPLPYTTKRSITTNLKSINNQKCQEIKLHATLTTKELKKKINQNNQTDKAEECTGQLRKTLATQWTLWAGLAAKLGRLHGRG